MGAHPVYAALEGPILLNMLVRFYRPEYLIVEPTGVGYLSNVINNFAD